MSQSPTFAPPGSASKTSYTTRVDNLEFGIITSVDDPKFEPTYNLFNSIFSHHGESFIDRPGFQKSFALNDDPEFQRQWGPAKLMLAYAYDTAADKVVGGTGFTAMVMPRELVRASKTDLLYFGAYVFVDPGCRGGGLALRLVEEREKASRAFAVQARPHLRDPAKVRLLAFNEQNDPRLMSLDDIRDDLEHSGTHPCNRILSSRALAGWRAVDARFRYVEIDRPGDPGIDTMVLNVKGPGTQPPPVTLPTSVLCRFLEVHAAVRRFGENPYQDAVFVSQLDQARALQVVVPQDDSEHIRKLRPLIDAQLQLPAITQPELPLATPVDSSEQAPARHFRALQRAYRPARLECQKRHSPSVSGGQGVWPLLRAQYKR